MSAKINTWIPIYVGDYLADTLDFTTEQHGAYLLLIFHYWKQKKPIKNDQKKLANISKISLTKWKKISPEILEKFEQKNGLLHHGRLDKEITQAIELRNKRSNAGKASVAAKGSTIVGTNAPTNDQQNNSKSDNKTSTSRERVFDCGCEGICSCIGNSSFKDKKRDANFPTARQVMEGHSDANFLSVAEVYSNFGKVIPRDDGGLYAKHVTDADCDDSVFATGLQNYLNRKSKQADPKYQNFGNFIREESWLMPGEVVPGPVRVPGAPVPPVDTAKLNPHKSKAQAVAELARNDRAAKIIEGEAS